MKPQTRLLSFSLLLFSASWSQSPQASPCANDPVYRQFDFWIGQWDVYGPKGTKAGASKVDLILDSCILLENWTSGGSNYSGKSFNTYNASTGQWQQTWVDNKGGSTAYLRGRAVEGGVVFYADSLAGANGKSFMRRLSFYKINADTVRQHGERSDDAGKTWTTEYDLQYRRKKM